MPPKICPNCGASVKSNAKCCRECGADETTGWSESAHADNLNLADEDFDHAEFVKSEFGEKQLKPTGIHWLWWLTAMVLVLLFLISFLR